MAKREPWSQSEYTAAYSLRHRGIKCRNVMCLRGLENLKNGRRRAFVILDAKDYRNQTMVIWSLRSLLHKHADECGAWHKIVEAEAAAAKATAQSIQEAA